MTFRKTLARGGAIVAGAALIAACSSSSGGSGDGGSGGTCTASPHACFDTCNPCSILTQSEVAAIVNVAVAAGDNSTDPHMCQYIYSDSSGLPALQVLIYTNINSQTFSQVCHPPSSSFDAGIVLTPVSGVGDDACYLSGGGNVWPDLNFEKGCWAYEIAVFGNMLSGATEQGYEKSIALAMLPKL